MQCGALPRRHARIPPASGSRTTSSNAYRAWTTPACTAPSAMWRTGAEVRLDIFITHYNFPGRGAHAARVSSDRRKRPIREARRKALRTSTWRRAGRHVSRPSPATIRMPPSRPDGVLSARTPSAPARRTDRFLQHNATARLFRGRIAHRFTPGADLIFWFPDMHMRHLTADHTASVIAAAPATADPPIRPAALRRRPAAAIAPRPDTPARHFAGHRCRAPIHSRAIR